MWLLSSRVVLSYSLFAVCHANETHRIKPRGTGTGVNPFPPTYSPIPSPTEAPSAMMTEPPAPEVDDPTTSPAPFILTPDEFHSSALEPTAIAECLAQASEQTGLPVLGFLVTLPLILSDSVVAFLVRLRKFLQTFIATDMLGCGLSRRADTRMIRNVQLDVSVYNATFGT